MIPLLRNREDAVVIKDINIYISNNGPLQKYDVILFEYNNNYILHRIIRIEKDIYITRGDNSRLTEKVSKDQVIGVMCGFFRNNIYIKTTNLLYKCISRFIVYMHFVVNKRSKSF